MTLQERMVAVYLRQAKLPPEEKDKLRLFLGLLLTTLDEEEAWEKELREADTSSDTADAAPPSPQGEGKKPVDPLAGEGASEETAEGSSADAPGEEPGMKDPLVYEVLERMEQEKLTKNKAADAIGVTALTLSNFLKGKAVYKATRTMIEDWMEPWMAAKEILG